MTECRFPPPWSVEEKQSAYFVARDHNDNGAQY